MSHPPVYAFSVTNRSHQNLLRRELCWLLKDQADENSGWGLGHGMIETHSPKEGVAAKLLAYKTSPSKIDKEVIDAIEDIAGDNGCLVAPFEYGLDTTALAKRLASTDEFIEIPSLSNPSTVIRIDVSNGIWTSDDLPECFYESIPKFGAAFNAAHPYQGGLVYDATDGTHYELSHQGFNNIANEDGPIYTALLSTTSVADDLSIITDKSLLNRIPKGTAQAPGSHADIDPRFDMVDLQDQAGIHSGGTCGGSILIRAPADDPHLPDLTGRLDDHGFGVAGYATVGGEAIVLYKMKPRHRDLKTLRPPFEPAFEHRKLELTEWSRDVIPGHRDFEGDRQTILDSFDGWQIIAEKPGRKDADDFIALVEGPGDIELEFDIDQAPFEKVFAEVRANAKCPQSGQAFMEALYQLYRAQPSDGTELSDAIAELAANLPPHSNQEELRYPNRRAFLWLLALLYIIEDINYRFSFHGVTAGPYRIKYRKQGRNQPMNALLQSVANMNADLSDLSEQAEGKGGLPGRPTFFDGPSHLEAWFESKILPE